jgi:hypothetical protein
MAHLGRIDCSKAQAQNQVTRQDVGAGNGSFG